MERVYATLRVGGADQIAPHIGSVQLRPSRLQSFFRATDRGIAFDLPENEQVRVHLTSSALPIQMLPASEVTLDTREVFGVRFRGRAASGECFVHFMDGSHAVSARRVDWETLQWFDPPEGTTGVAFSVIVGGRGELVLEGLEVVLPPSPAHLPAGEPLLRALAIARFPKGSTSWPLDFDVHLKSPDVVSISGFDLSLREPDWEEVGTLDRTRQLLIHGMAATETILAEHPEGAALMADLLSSWQRHHPSRPHSTTVMSWNDMAVAKRTVAILAVLDQIRFSDGDTARDLAEMAASHARWLSHARNYLANHDHGLYADTALELAARALAVHPLSERWRKLASHRFSNTARAVINRDEATVLEHSPAYVDAIARLLRERREHGLVDELGDLADKLEETLAVLTTPSGFLLPWGDTSLRHRSDRERPRGVYAFPATGWCVSHHDETSVGLTSSFHSRSHKHRDELSISVFDRAGPVIFEAGLPGYTYGSDDRTYAEAAVGHSTVVFEPDVVRSEEPFGGAVAVASSGDWHALLGWNPLLGEEAAHYRVVFHHDRQVAVVDVLVGPSFGRVTRLFHIGPDLTIERGPGSVRIGQWTMTLSDGDESSFEIEAGGQWRHFPTPSSTATHSVIKATSHGPGVLGAMVSKDGNRITRISTRGNEEEMAIAVELDSGEKLEVIGSPPRSPRSLRLSVSESVPSRP